MLIEKSHNSSVLELGENPKEVGHILNKKKKSFPSVSFLKDDVPYDA